VRPVASSAFPVAAVYVLAGLAAALAVAGIAIGVRRIRAS
jgi:hypothetical protein